MNSWGYQWWAIAFIAALPTPLAGQSDLPPPARLESSPRAVSQGVGNRSNVSRSATRVPISRTAPRPVLDPSDWNLVREALNRQVPADSETSRAVVLRVSESYIQSQMTRQIDTTTDVDQFAFGTRARGRARTTGTALVEFKPADQVAAFQIRLTGCNVSDTVGRNGPAVIYTRSTSHFTCVKPIVFSRETGFITKGAGIQIATDVRTRGVGATVPGLRGCIVRRVASRRSAAMRPQVTAFARQKAEERIRAAVDQKVDQMLAELNRRADVRQVAMALLGVDLTVRTSTSDSHLTIVLAGSAEQAASLKLPPLTNPESPLQVYIHRSLIGPRLERGLTGFLQVRDRLLPLLSLTTLSGQAPLAEGNRPLNVSMLDAWIAIRPAEEGMVPRVNIARRPITN